MQTTNIYAQKQGMLQTSAYLLVDQVDRTANIDVHKVHINRLVQELCTFGHRVWKCSLQLPKGDSLHELKQQLFLPQK